MVPPANVAVELKLTPTHPACRERALQNLNPKVCDAREYAEALYLRVPVEFLLQTSASSLTASRARLTSLMRESIALTGKLLPLKFLGRKTRVDLCAFGLCHFSVRNRAR